MRDLAPTRCPAHLCLPVFLSLPAPPSPHPYSYYFPFLSSPLQARSTASSLFCPCAARAISSPVYTVPRNYVCESFGIVKCEEELPRTVWPDRLLRWVTGDRERMAFREWGNRDLLYLIQFFWQTLLKKYLSTLRRRNVSIKKEREASYRRNSALEIVRLKISEKYIDDICTFGFLAPCIFHLYSYIVPVDFESSFYHLDLLLRWADAWCMAKKIVPSSVGLKCSTRCFRFEYLRASCPLENILAILLIVFHWFLVNKYLTLIKLR